MSIKGAYVMPATAQLPSDRQRLFLYYFTAALTDLVVLGLFDQYSDKVAVDSFSTMLLAAVVLQILLKLTIVVEHKVLAKFEGRTGGLWKFSKFFTAWLILFGSKFVILEALDVAFGDSVRFEGAFHGIVWLIIVVVAMLLAEELVLRIYRKLA
jgi:hypothetical protein